MTAKTTEVRDKMEKFCIPVVSAIIERTNAEGEKEILIQTRWKPDRSPKYSGLLEIQAGAIREWEDIYEAITRELREEVGLKVKSFKQHETSKVYNFHDDHGFAFKPFCAQYMKKGAPFLGVVFLVEVEEGTPVAQKSEVRDPKWIKVSELKRLFDEKPEMFFTLYAGVIELYLKRN